jgi:hypothetical protein
MQNSDKKIAKQQDEKYEIKEIILKREVESIKKNVKGLSV